MNSPVLMETVTASRVLVRAFRQRDHMPLSMGRPYDEPYDAADEDCLKRT